VRSKSGPVLNRGAVRFVSVGCSTSTGKTEVALGAGNGNAVYNARRTVRRPRCLDVELNLWRPRRRIYAVIIGVATRGAGHRMLQRRRRMLVSAIAEDLPGEPSRGAR